MAAARQMAMEMASLNHSASHAPSLAAGDVLFGYVSSDGVFVESSTPSEIDTIKARIVGHSQDTFFGRAVFAEDEVTLASDAYATRRSGVAGAVSNFIPLAIPTCVAEQIELGTPVDYEVLFAAGGDTNGKWTFPSGECCGATKLTEQLSSRDEFGRYAVGDTIDVFHGTKNSVRKRLVSMIEESGTEWDTTRFGTKPTQQACSQISADDFGKTLEGPMPVFSTGNATIDAGICKGKYTLKDLGVSEGVVTGFVWGVFYDVTDTSGGGSSTSRVRASHDGPDSRTDRKCGTTTTSLLSSFSSGKKSDSWRGTSAGPKGGSGKGGASASSGSSGSGGSVSCEKNFFLTLDAVESHLVWEGGIIDSDAPDYGLGVMQPPVYIEPRGEKLYTSL